MLDDILFWTKLDRQGPTRPNMESCCWLWTGRVNADGYGEICRSGKVYKAHRWAFKLAYGTFPNTTLHQCDVPACCRPTHLADGTQQENCLDSARKDRHWQIKITMEQAEAIRDEVVRGPRGTAARLAREYEVSPSCISKIVNGLQRV